MGAAVLLVEDDENLRIALQDNLVDEGHRVRAVATLAEARRALERDPFDVVVLDLMLPDGDGTSLCRAMKDDGHPARVLMLTARTLEDDLVRGFAEGADDYLKKPYRLRELLARVAALARRGGAPTAGGATFCGFVLDEAARLLRGADGRAIDLTRSEFDVLKVLLDNRHRAVTRDQILDEVRGKAVMVDERTVDNFVSSLKKKLGWTKDARWRIASVRGIGYRMEVDER
jgi:DNA-binding response OmpR family regulator